MRRIAVLGSNGQLGKTLKALIEKELDEYLFYSRHDIDITDKEALKRILEHQNFDFCINCAAFTNVDAAEKNVNDAFLSNVKGVKNIAELCSDLGIRLIHISTDYVFDGNTKVPYKEEDKTNPINQYGKSKLEGELYIRKNLKEYYIIRTSWLYSIYGKNFLKTIIDKIEKNEKLKITTEEKGTPTSAIDLTEFILFIVKNDKVSYGIYNFSAKGSTTWYGFAREIVNNSYPKRKNNIIPTNNFKTLAKRPKYSVLDISKTEGIYKDLNQWRESVKFLVEYYKTISTKN